jgi:EmrB/QacA subfamily drug resistance transporter
MSHTDREVPKNTALFITAFASFITPFMGSSINVALPDIGGNFSMDAVTLSWVNTSYLLASAVFLVPMGKLADIAGRRKIFLTGIVLLTLSSAAIVFSGGTIMFITLRVMQGLSSAMIFGTALAIITSVFPASERGKAMGINISAIYLGLTLGPFLGGVLTHQFGWESIFFVIVPFGIVVFLLSRFKLKQEWAEAHGEPFDWPGSLLYGAALTAFMAGLSVLPKTWGYLLITAGVAGMITFVVVERRKAFPVFNMDLFFKNRVFAISSFSALINYSATFGISFLMSLYLQYVKDMSPQAAGEILAIQPVIMALFSPFTGRLSDRLDPGLVATIGLLLLTTGLFIFTGLSMDSSFVFIGTTLGIFGLGFAFFSSPNTNAIMGSVEKKYYGLASGTVGTMRLIGQLISMGVVMLLFSLIIGEVSISRENQQAFLTSARTSFLIFALLALAGVVLSSLRIRKTNGSLLKRNY